MIHDIIEHIDSKISLINKHYGLVEHYRTHIGTEQETIYPAKKVDSFNYQGINLDYHKSESYHRIIGIVKYETDNSCNAFITETIPMRAVFKFDINDPCLPHYLANIIKLNNPQELKPISINSRAVSYNVDTYDIWQKEFIGIPYKLPSNYALISIDYNITLFYNNQCLQDPCEC